MPGYLPADRFTYGFAIIAAIVFAFALRDGGEFAAKRLSPVISIRSLTVSLVGIVLSLLAICSYGLVANLHQWENTHTLMARLQNTAPSQGVRFFAKLHDADYWKSSGNIQQMQKALLSFLDSPQGNEEETLVRAVQFLVSNSRCMEARYLVRMANAQFIPSAAAVAQLDSTILRSCE